MSLGKIYLGNLGWKKQREKHTILPLEKWGNLEFLERNSLILKACSEDLVYFKLCEPFVGSAFVYYWLRQDSARLILIGLSSRTVYYLDVPARQLYVAASLYRRMEDDPGLCRLTLIEYQDDLLVVYEGGILYLDSDLRCRWKVDHAFIDRIFTRIADGCAWYESEHEGMWGYRLTDGSQINPPI